MNLYGYRVRLCARCSGYLLGFIAPHLVYNYFRVDLLGSMDPDTQLLACVLFALPYALDWVTQSWGIRESSNWLRLATGILLGVDIFIFSRGGSLHTRRLIFIGVALIVALIGYLGKLKRPRQLSARGVGSPKPFCEDACC